MTDQIITYDLNDIHNIINNYENNIQDEETSCYKVKKIPHNNIHYNKYLIKYKKDKLTNENINRVGLFRSVVVYKDNKTDKLSIKVFSPPKSSAYNLFISDESNKFNECYISEIVDGTMINMFYDEYIDKWIVCTKSNIGAACKFNLDSNHTFKSMFVDAFEECSLNYDLFNKTYSYSFVLKHPNNRIVTPVKKPSLVLISVYKFVESKVIDVTNYNTALTQFIPKPPTFKYYEFNELFGGEFDDEWLQLTYVCSEKILRYDIPGYNIYNKFGVRTKIRNLSYEHVKRMKGNGQKLLFTYLRLRNNDDLLEFLEYFPEYKEEFNGYKERLYSWTEKIYNFYVDCFIYKSTTLKNCPFEVKPILYDIQNQYLNELKPNGRKVNFKFIVEYIKKMPVQKIMFSMNYSLRPVNTMEEQATSE
tara:strand:- start:13265 stop:14521 length:1257 start_codon:yes stop_codon:yes gene_type:complete